ncbi:MAG: hypothetical protein ABL956_07070 [Hyphomonadaceae bacterium]
MTSWYARPILHVADAQASIYFYRDRLSFYGAWRHVENSELLLAQVSRDGGGAVVSG